jgi:uncharacterized protein (DUF1697 family)
LTRYVALLRGINVGGRNMIAMAALKACFEAQGFSDVVTLIQSGNVMFGAHGKAPTLTARIESTLSETFAYPASIVLRSLQQLRRIVTKAPARFGSRPALYRYDVLFLRDPLKSSAALKLVPRQAGVDRVVAGPGVLYFSRLIRKASQSRLSRLVSLPIYQQMTIRNWNTTTRLLQLMEAP